MTIYKEQTGSGADIVLFHGWGCCHEYMRNIAQHLATHFRVTNINLPGSGKTPWCNAKSIDDIADYLVDSLPETAIYIGWSFGGAVAASIAARYPDKVKQFIGVSTTPKFVTEGDWPALPEPGYKAGFKVSTQEEFQQLLQGFIDGEYQSLDPKPANYHAIQALLKNLGKRDLDVLRQGVDIIDATDLREWYKNIKCPIDLILGEEDPAMPREQYPLLEALNPKITLHIIPNAQHMSFWTHEKEFFAILDAILKKNS